MKSVWPRLVAGANAIEGTLGRRVRIVPGGEAIAPQVELGEKPQEGKHFRANLKGELEEQGRYKRWPQNRVRTGHHIPATPSVARPIVKRRNNGRSCHRSVRLRSGSGARSVLLGNMLGRPMRLVPTLATKTPMKCGVVLGNRFHQQAESSPNGSSCHHCHLRKTSEGNLWQDVPSSYK